MDSLAEYDPTSSRPLSSVFEFDSDTCSESDFSPESSDSDWDKQNYDDGDPRPDLKDGYANSVTHHLSTSLPFNPTCLSPSLLNAITNLLSRYRDSASGAYLYTLDFNLIEAPLNYVLDDLYRGHYLPPLRDAAEKAVVFLFDEVVPFCLLWLSSHYTLIRPGVEARGMRLWAGDGEYLEVPDVRRTVQIGPVLRAYMNLLYWMDRNLRLRWKMGMLRDAQVRLIERCIKGMMGEIQELMEWRPSETVSISGKGGEEVLDVVVRWSGLVGFLSGERFRSERLEVLLERYISEKSS